MSDNVKVTFDEVEDDIVVDLDGGIIHFGNLQIGTTTTGESGSEASVTNSGTPESAILNFTIPKGNKGDKGDTGPSNTLSIGTVEKGEEASATLTGDSPNQVLSLVLPKGDKGDPFVYEDFTVEQLENLKGDNYEITDKDYEVIEEQVKVDIQPLLNDINEVSDNALEVAKSAENIAKGKSASIVFETFEEMEVWLKNATNKGAHNIGDNLYIKQMWIDEEAGIRQPDYWITEVLDEPNDKGYYYEISDLGVEHPDLTNFLETDEIKEKYLLITYEDGTTETVKLVVYK